MFKNLGIILFTSVFIDNYVLNRFLGICPFLGVSRRIDRASGMGMAVLFVMLASSAITWPIGKYILERYDLRFLETLVFILVIATMVQLIEIALKRFIPSLHRGLGIYLPLITTNCAVLGVAINNINDGYSFIEAMTSALGCGLGFLLAMLIFSGVRSRIDSAVGIPECIKGLPITLIAASVVSLAFLGFSGMGGKIFR